jgi:hypothetical protein
MAYRRSFFEKKKNRVHSLLAAVLRIRMFLDLLDPDPGPLVRGKDPDPGPSVIQQK